MTPEPDIGGTFVRLDHRPSCAACGDGGRMADDQPCGCGSFPFPDRFDESLQVRFEWQGLVILQHPQYPIRVKWLGHNEPVDVVIRGMARRIAWLERAVKRAEKRTTDEPSEGEK